GIGIAHRHRSSRRTRRLRAQRILATDGYPARQEPPGRVVGLEAGSLESLVTRLRPDPAFWRGKRDFATGHTGFQGSWLCLWLRSLGAQVHGFALAPPTVP